MRKRFERVRERGAAAVEFALVLPVLVLLILGMVDFGFAISAEAIVGNAARDGARVASLGGSESVAKSAALKSSSSLVGTPPTVNVKCLQADLVTACPGANYDAARSVGSIVVVTVSYNYHYITPFVSMVGVADPLVVSKSSYMRIETTS